MGVPAATIPEQLPTAARFRAGKPSRKKTKSFGKPSQNWRRDREVYYRSLSGSLEANELFERLEDLLRRTHRNQPKYQPSKYVYRGSTSVLT